MRSDSFRQLLVFGLSMMVIITIVLAEASASPNDGARLRLSISTTAAPPFSHSDGTGLIDQIMAEAMHRLGRTHEMVTLPPERAMLDLAHGLYDGTATQVAGLQRQYPQLIQVPFSLLRLDLVAFTKRHDVVVHRWEELLDYSIAYIGGWRLLDEQLHDMQSVTRVKDVDQLFGLLQRDRVDLVIYSRMMGLSYIKRHQLMGVHLLLPALSSPPMFIYLHKRHAALVAPLVAVLQQMEAEGWNDGVRHQVLDPLRTLQRLLY